MNSTSIGSWIGTLLMLGGIVVCTLAALVGVAAIGADVFGADRSAVVYLAITAIFWAIAGGYYLLYGNWVRGNFR